MRNALYLVLCLRTRAKLGCKLKLFLLESNTKVLNLHDKLRTTTDIGSPNYTNRSPRSFGIRLRSSRVGRSWDMWLHVMMPSSALCLPPSFFSLTSLLDSRLLPNHRETEEGAKRAMLDGSGQNAASHVRTGEGHHIQLRSCAWEGEGSCRGAREVHPRRHWSTH